MNTCPVCGKPDTENCIETAIICPRKRILPDNDIISLDPLEKELIQCKDCNNYYYKSEDNCTYCVDNNTQIPYSNQGEMNPDR